MTAEQLRNSILQEAISGRLVPQYPNDEPAKVIFEETQKERLELLSSKEIRKSDLVVSDLDEEQMFDLPEGWEWTTVDRIAIVKGGKRIPVGKTFSPTPTPYMYIRVTEMKNNTLIDCEHKYISAELRELLKRYIIHSTDIYVTIAGTIGAVGDVPEKFDGMNLTENALKLSHLHMDKKFLIYALSSPFVQEQFKEKTNKVGQPKLAMERVKNTIFPLPPLAEQKRIVAKLEELLPIVEQYGKAQTELDELNAALPARLRQSILQEAISGRLVPQDPNEEPASVLLARIREEKARLVKEGKLKKKDLVETPITEEEIPFEIPASWEWVRLGYLVDFSKSSSVKASSISPNAWILDLEDIQKNTGVLLRKKRMGETVSISDKHQFKKGNVLYSKLRPYLNKVIVADEDGYCTSEILCFNFGEINNRYAQLFLMSAFFVDYAMKDAYGVKMPRLGSKQGNNALFPLPPLAEQKRIVAKIEELFAEIDKLK